MHIFWMNCDNFDRNRIMIFHSFWCDCFFVHWPFCWLIAIQSTFSSNSAVSKSQNYLTDWCSKCARGRIINSNINAWPHSLHTVNTHKSKPFLLVAFGPDLCLCSFSPILFRPFPSGCCRECRLVSVQWLSDRIRCLFPCDFWAYLLHFESQQLLAIISTKYALTDPLPVQSAVAPLWPQLIHQFVLFWSRKHSQRLLQRMPVYSEHINQIQKERGKKTALSMESIGCGFSSDSSAY